MNDRDFEKLVFGMAHQIRNPSAIIKANAGVILKRENLSPEGLRSMESILNGVKYLEERLDEFVEFSKPLKLTLKEVALDKLLAEACSMLNEQCRMKHIQVTTTLEPIKLKAADRSQLILSFLNVILNGVEAIASGGNVIIEARQSGGRALISIRDNGMGIHPRDMAEIFSPFYSTKPNSIGIGLPVAKRIIEAHGGKISAESAQGKGTSVNIELPITHG